jgi:hypothetical protein
LLLNHPMVLHFLINSKSTIHLVIFNKYIYAFLFTMCNVFSLSNHFHDTKDKIFD